MGARIQVLAGGRASGTRKNGHFWVRTLPTYSMTSWLQLCHKSHRAWWSLSVQNRPYTLLPL